MRLALFFAYHRENLVARASLQRRGSGRVRWAVTRRGHFGPKWPADLEQESWSRETTDLIEARLNLRPLSENPRMVPFTFKRDSAQIYNPPLC